MRLKALLVAIVALFATAGAVEACARAIVDGGDVDSGGCMGSGCTDATIPDGGVPPSPDGGCPSGDVLCGADGGKGGTCVNTSSDMNHCGNCTTTCIAQIETCEAGKCESACGAKTLCIPDAGAPDGGDAGTIAAHCADTQMDTSDCGGCGHACPMGATCNAGKCSCTSTGMKVFSYTGATQTWLVPCVSTVTVTVLGAQGANASDVKPSVHTFGKGGSATGTLTVTSGETLYINVGGQGTTTGGWNGGGTGGNSTAGSGCFGGYAGAGGGMSDIRQGGMALSNIVIAAGGGGGSGRSYCNGTCVPCGCGGGNGGGGGTTGVSGGAASNCGYGYPGSGVNGGAGGTQSSGGTAGPGDGTGASGSAGTQGMGGNGGAGTYDVAGGGAGGGYYGGGGGGSATNASGVGGGGGAGGSSYIGGVSGGSTTSATQSGDGQITISW